MERVNRDSIGHIQNIPAEKLARISTREFTHLLEANYGTDKVKQAVGWLFTPTTAAHEKGLATFRDNYLTSYVGDGKMSGESQKYLAGLVQGVAAGRFSPTTGADPSIPKNV